MSRERPGHTLQTTAILNEAYLRLVDDTKPLWQGRSHFIAAAAQLMRRIMVDHARQRQSLKRGGGALKVTLDEAALVTGTRSEELLALDEALETLAAQDPRKSQIVEMRYFGGSSRKETDEYRPNDRGTRSDHGEGMALRAAERGRELMKLSAGYGSTIFHCDHRTCTRGAGRVLDESPRRRGLAPRSGVAAHLSRAARRISLRHRPSKSLPNCSAYRQRRCGWSEN